MWIFVNVIYALRRKIADYARIKCFNGKIDCGFEEKAAYTYSLDDRRKIEREVNALEKLGFRRVKEFTYQGRRLYRYLLQLN